MYRCNTRLIQPQFHSERDQLLNESLAATVNRIRVVWSVNWDFVKQRDALQEQEEQEEEEEEEEKEKKGRRRRRGRRRRGRRRGE